MKEQQIMNTIKKLFWGVILLVTYAAQGASISVDPNQTVSREETTNYVMYRQVFTWGESIRAIKTIIPLHKDDFPGRVSCIWEKQLYPTRWIPDYGTLGPTYDSISIPESFFDELESLYKQQQTQQQEQPCLKK